MELSTTSVFVTGNAIPIQLVGALRAVLISASSSACSLGLQMVTAAHGMALIIIGALTVISVHGVALIRSHIFTGDAVAAQIADAWRVTLDSTFAPSAANISHIPVFGSGSRDAVRCIVTA